MQNKICKAKFVGGAAIPFFFPSHNQEGLNLAVFTFLVFLVWFGFQLIIHKLPRNPNLNLLRKNKLN
jgi:hypothetical protein